MNVSDRLWPFEQKEAQMDDPTSKISTGPLVVRVPKCCQILDTGKTRVYELIRAGELESFLDGKVRKVTIDSIHAYVARKIAAQKIAA